MFEFSKVIVKDLEYPVATKLYGGSGKGHPGALKQDISTVTPQDDLFISFAAITLI